jgi:glycosidase
MLKIPNTTQILTPLRIYQILVRLFGNPNPNPVLNGSRSENGCGTLDDLNNLALKSIADLGCNAVWLTGLLRHATQTSYDALGIERDHPSVIKGKAGSPYAVSDFFDIDPDLARNPDKRMKAFEDCRDRIHGLGLKLIIDFVPNHTARLYHSPAARSLGLRDLGQDDFQTESFHPNNHYYYITNQELQLPEALQTKKDPYREFPAKATGNDCFTAFPSETDWYETVKLNYGVRPGDGAHFFHPIPPTWFYMEQVLRFWAAKGVDGFRCDMVELVPIEFWAWVIPRIQAAFPVFFIGEVYNPQLYRRHLEEGHFSYLYDKVGLYDVLRDLCEGKGNANSITQVWQSQEGISHRMLRFMENHDEQRMASPFVAENPEKVLPAMAITCLLGKGPIMIYAGQELGEKAEGGAGFSGDDGKTTIFDYFSIPGIVAWNNHGTWNPENLPSETLKLRKAYQELLQLHAGNAAFQDGHFYDLQYANQNQTQYPSEKAYAFLRYTDKEKFLVVASFQDQAAALRIRVPKDAWISMGISLEDRCQLIPRAGTGKPSEFYVTSTFESDGGSAGILILLPAFGYGVYEIATKNQA